MTRAFLTACWRRVHAALVAIVLLPVFIYRRVLSPMKRAPSCRYVPTCSEYAVDAVRARGILVGIALAVWRVLRCNPLFRGGYDPVIRDDCRAPLRGGSSPAPSSPCRPCFTNPREHV